MTEWRDVFCGRKGELKQLVDAYESVAAGAGPRLAVVCADRGMGKTRLVQELYRRLSTTCDPDDYWPDASLFKGNNLRVAPDFNDPQTQAHFASFTTAERPMPFLWWGFRLNDPLDRNAVRSDMAGHRRTLDPHLERARFAREHAARRAAIQHAAKDAARDAALKIGEAMLESVPGVGLGKNLIEVGIGMFKTARSHVQARQQEDAFATADLAALEEQRKQDIYECTLEDLAAVLAPAAGLAAVPAVVFCDDAQFARDGGDEGALRFLDQLWRRAEEGGWPLLLVATHWAVDWEQDRSDPAPAFASVFAAVADDARRSTIIQLTKDADLAALAEQGLPGLPRQDVELLLRKVDGNPQVLIELVGRIHASPAWRTRQGGLSAHGRKQIEAHSCNLTTLITERLLSDATPPEVRVAVALSSLQGMQFLCPLTEATADAMRLGAVGNGIAAAAHPLRLVVGVEAGVASFVQRAYRDAAYSLVESQLGDPEEVKGGLLAAAVDLIDADAREAQFSGGQRRALLGIVATLGSQSADARQRAHAATSLVRLVESETDSASRAAYARRFVDGLGQLWNASSFDDDQLAQIRNALDDWDGWTASYRLDQKLLEEHRRAYAHDPDRAALGLIEALHMMAVHERWADEPRKAVEHTQESVELSRVALSRSLLTEDELADHLMFAADLRSPTGALDEVAASWRDEALATRRRRFEAERDYPTCDGLVDALKRAAKWCRDVDDAAGSERLLREAVDAVRVLRQQPGAGEMPALPVLGFQILTEYLEPMVLTADRRFTLRSVAAPEQLLPIVLDWADFAIEAHAAIDDATSVGWVIMTSGIGALVAIRAGRREQAAALFDRCRELAQQVSDDPSARSHALTVAAFEALVHGDLRAARDALGHVAQVTRDARLWSDHYDALALHARLDRLDLLVLMDPDPEAEDKAAVLPSALSNLRQGVASFVPDDTEAADAFAQITKWLGDGATVDLLEPETVDACVHEVAVLCADFDRRCGGRERLAPTRVEWLMAMLSALALGSRNEPTAHFDSLWELAPDVLGPLIRAGCELRQLDRIATALAELGFARDSYAVHGAAIRVTRELVERSADPDYRRDLAFRLTLFGLLCVQEEDFERAGELLGEALELSTALVSENESAENLLSLGRVLDGWETLSQRADAPERAVEYRSRRRAVLERLVHVSEGREGKEELSELQHQPDSDMKNPVVLH